MYALLQAMQTFSSRLKVETQRFAKIVSICTLSTFCTRSRIPNEVSSCFLTTQNLTHKLSFGPQVLSLTNAWLLHCCTCLSIYNSNHFELSSHPQHQPFIEDLLSTYIAHLFQKQVVAMEKKSTTIQKKKKHFYY